jgi:hypothetical protein
MRPDADLTVSEWADAHRMLGSRASAEPGRYRTARTPYMREIMDALSPSSAVQRIVFMKAAQVGATEAGNNWIGFAIHQAPGPMLAVQPTVELAKRNSRQRIDPLIEESPELRERVKPARSRDAGNTMLSKEFAGGILIMTGANSAVGLRSTPARYIFLDEVDAYPASADKGGDPVSLAEARSLMRLIDVQFLETPFFGVRQMTWHLRNEGHIRKWMEFYNYRRPHKALGGQPPAVVHSLQTEVTQPDQQEHRRAKKAPDPVQGVGSTSASGFFEAAARGPKRLDKRTQSDQPACIAMQLCLPATQIVLAVFDLPNIHTRQRLKLHALLCLNAVAEGMLYQRHFSYQISGLNQLRLGVAPG